MTIINQTLSPIYHHHHTINHTTAIELMKSNRNSLDYQLSLVSASDEFPIELRRLRTLDSTLRCPICKEFYQAPVIIHIPKCCHTFCSACVRTSFNNNSNNHRIGATGLGGVGNSHRCPICKVEAQEEKLKPVPTLESAVVCWQEAREEIFAIIQRIQSLESSQSKLASSSGSPSTTDLARSQLSSSTKLSKHQLETPAREHHSNLKTRSTRASKSLAKRKLQDSSEFKDASDNEIELLSYNPTDPSAPVKCPICDTKMLNSDMDHHLTRCLDAEKKSKPVGSTQAKKLKTSHGDKKVGGTKTDQNRIPLPHFASLKPKDLKAELMKHHLKIEGSTNVQLRRLSKFITLFNANLDSKLEHQKSLESLHKELRDWEALQDSIGSNTKIDKILDNPAGHLSRHKSHFDMLIQQASRSLRSPKVAEEPASDQVVSQPTPTDASRSQSRSNRHTEPGPGVDDHHPEGGSDVKDDHVASTLDYTQDVETEHIIQASQPFSRSTDPSVTPTGSPKNNLDSRRMTQADLGTQPGATNSGEGLEAQDVGQVKG